MKKIWRVLTGLFHLGAFVGGVLFVCILGYSFYSFYIEEKPPLHQYLTVCPPEPKATCSVVVFDWVKQDIVKVEHLKKRSSLVIPWEDILE